MNDPENKDLKPQDDTAEQPTAAQEESDGTELSDEELGDAAGGAMAAEESVTVNRTDCPGETSSVKFNL